MSDKKQVMIEGEEIERSLKDLLRETFEKGGKIILPTKSLIDATINDITFGAIDGCSLEVIFPLVVGEDGLRIGFEREDAA